MDLRTEDLRASDLALAIAAPGAVLVFVVSLFAGPQAPAPSTSTGEELAVQVMSVVDDGVARGGGGGGRGSEGGGRAGVGAAASEGDSEASPEASAVTKKKAAQSRSKRGARRRAPAVSAEGEPATSAAEEPPGDPGGDPGAAEAVPGEGSEGGVSEGGVSGGEPGDGQPGDGQSGDGQSGLAAKAISAYRQRLIRWLARRFTVRGSGLSQAQLQRLNARVEVDVAESGVVTGYRVLEAGHPAFDRAAREALGSILGESVPPPPDYYPGAVPSPLRVTFICAESTCD